MKRENLTFNVEQSSKNVDYSSILFKFALIGKTVLRHIIGVNFALTLCGFASVAGIFLAVLESPDAKWAFLVAAITSLRCMFSFKKGGLR